MDRAAAAECCASCGISQVDDVKLKDCDNCDLVKYCSDGCQENHSEHHEEECKKRRAELRDRDLFTMPEGRHWGECPICCLPQPIDPTKTVFMQCCSQFICFGCDYANQMRENEAGLEHRCAFCREPLAKSKEENEKRVMERIKKNDPVAMCRMGNKHLIEGDHETALEYLTKAAELGDVDAHYQLSVFYFRGECVEKDRKKHAYHLELATIGGHPMARHNLGIVEGGNGRYERAKKHWIIAANLGHEESLKCLRKLYAEGKASKEDYAGALRAFQAAVNATNSREREEAEAYFQALRRG